MTETEEQQMELLEYISEMLNMISSGDDTIDAASIEVVADTVHARAVQLHAEYRKLLQANRKHLLKEIKQKNRNSANVDESAAQGLESIVEEEKSEPPKREHIVNFLWTVRAEFLAEINSGTDRENAGKKIGKKFGCRMLS